MAENGPLETWEFSNIEDFLNKYVCPYLNIMKKPVSLLDGNCNREAYFIDGSSRNYSDHNFRFYFTDGTSVTSQIHTNTDVTKRILITIDINGDKKPNKFGRDIFEYSYYLISENSTLNGKFLPSDSNLDRTKLMSTSYNWSCPNKGTSCAAVIMKDGWRIADDYPW